ncbi:xanthine dehydrogenase family protein molybdopterin-binding subunit [Novosphingobium flavum]|uniref:Xanthine dehydrogenase family protein molybdopterin-binding subunit n=1 Tax=Novosphingobium flavum TaxID=1778672 RepID=A0A7X1FU05_9SPHN|nr:molybdopterin cofactor-binding domain-containing protein [Novosphingobium flavum]MBC2666964.1 xanthine dehydrogenase family protein molybdopterin-binding subunit [Novosphingobium flavum]
MAGPLPRLTRRGVLIGGALGGGLLLAWGLTPRRFPPPLVPGKDQALFGNWLTIGADGVVTVAVPQLEMGQGITTLIPQVVALELGADWRMVAAEPAPISGAYANLPLAEDWAGLWMAFASRLAEGRGAALARAYAERNAFMATADGTSMAAYEQGAREAACAARTMLMQAAADRWDADWRECKVAAGRVTHGNQSASFGELAELAVRYDPPSDLPLLPPPADGADAISFPRLDGPAKVGGGMTFAGDLRLPGLLHAAIRHGPLAASSELAHVDEAKANRPGVRLVRGEGWLAATAPTWWAAEQALTAVAPTFKADRPVDSERTAAALDKAVRKAATQRIATVGDPDAVIAGEPSHVARYDIEPALPLPLETASATARVSADKVEIWVAAQSPETTRRAVARALGVSAGKVVLYPLPAGGSFDARLETPHAVEAALIAREVEKPVQLTWSRWQETLAALPRAPAAAVLWAKTNPDGGEVLAWKARIATPAAAREFGRRLFGAQTPQQARTASLGEADPMAVAGGMPPYRLPNASLDHVPVGTGIPAGRMRGKAHAMTAFFTESFVDELARKAGREPLSYRMEMLGDDLRLAECLQRCAALAQWDAGADASGQGLACHRMGENEDAPDSDQAARIAVIATARRTEAGVSVDRISAVADLGRIVNRDIARQQVEGGLVFGLGLALGSSISYARGLPLTARLGEMGLPLLASTPEIAVEFITSDKPAIDPGEIGVVAIAPAIANALHSATGLRFRRLPLFAEDL